ncbi:outer membrane lipid asymmetry maintenance protein MlaD [Pelagibius litoralis]|uniref:Outer membrane lipid asymmetry maintenance protein MlaD n=1 Tax=Pelagibius litoralis TaxID=374515 RepID=A0A967EXC0_9PROT|nr:outer membrane lipid asymmetry maintenance protein MlaD [Pelagibius litoralis]NIA68765.1 outer membrane lipid asymmetry maintenance protein MlaD [Pelagibius litoralis]
MRRNMIETIMGAVVLLVAVSFVIFAFRTTSLQSANSGGYELLVEFDDASGLVTGTDVRMAGVKVGSVLSQRLNPDTYFAQVSLTINEAIKLPSDSSARIIPEGLLGGNYVALEPGGADDYLSDGGQIQFTQGSINVVDLLGRFIFSAADLSKPAEDAQ